MMTGSRVYPSLQPPLQQQLQPPLQPSLLDRESTPRRPVRSDARHNREAIIRTARELYLAAPEESAMVDVARRAGVSIGTLMRHFPKRSDLNEAVYQHGLGELRALAKRSADADDPWLALVDWLHAFLDFSHLTLAMFGTFDRIVARAPDLESRRREIDEAFGGIFDRAHAAGVLRRGLTRRDLIQLVGGLVFSLSSDELRHEYLFGILLDGIKAQA